MRLRCVCTGPRHNVSGINTLSVVKELTFYALDERDLWLLNMCARGLRTHHRVSGVRVDIERQVSGGERQVLSHLILSGSRTR